MKVNFVVLLIAALLGATGFASGANAAQNVCDNFASINPLAGAAGTMVSISGSGYYGYKVSQVSLDWDGMQSHSIPVAGDFGAFSENFQVPLDAAPGVHVLTLLIHWQWYRTASYPMQPGNRNVLVSSSPVMEGEGDASCAYDFTVAAATVRADAYPVGNGSADPVAANLPNTGLVVLILLMGAGLTAIGAVLAGRHSRQQ